MVTFAVILFSAAAFGQTAFVPTLRQTMTFGPAVPSAPEAPATLDAPEMTAGAHPGPNFIVPSFSVSSLDAGTFDEDAGGTASIQPLERQPGLVHRSVKRILEDQKGIYLAPFEPAHLKYDAALLSGTAIFLVTDRHIENNLPGGHYQLYQDASNIAIGGLSATLGGVWLYGIKGDHPHAKETGEIELETLVNTFLVYTPMQFIAARQRPGEGNGHGDFLKHPMINTSFPGGHAMFTWAMATVVAHEYSQPWVRVLNYTAAFTVTLTRFLARDHWASDMWVGTGLGLAIGTYTFHQRCDPELSSSCRRHYDRIAKRNMKSKLDYAPGSPQWNAELKNDYTSGRSISQ
jgi:PAP2 superfamily protein